MYTLRPYQSAAVAAFWNFLRVQSGNAIITLPTGAGKSLVVAQLCADAIRWAGRVVVLAHRAELLKQNAEKIRALLPDASVGLYSAGLNKRQIDADILVAGIQSIYKKAYGVGRRNLVLIDEVHLVPHDGEGAYRHFLGELRSANERLRMGGLTATPFRLDVGPLCRPDGLFQKVCYSAPIRELIDGGYLSALTTKPAALVVDTSKIHLRGGEFLAGEAESVFNQATDAACAEIVQATAGRRSILIFCSGVQHAEHVKAVIESLSGEPCGLVTGDTLPLERSSMLAAFGNRRLRFLCNVDVLTTGFDAPCIDAIAILRATMSAGLYAQICGRGFRLFSGKTNCLILDFGNNIARHGPLDAIDYGRCKNTGDKTGEVPTKTCPNCGEEVFIGAGECACGWVFPITRKSHEATADLDTPILSEPETWDVDSVFYSVHTKKKGDGPATLRVDYVVSQDGKPRPQPISEWICLDHDGFTRRKAERWWSARSIMPPPNSVAEAVELANRGCLAFPRSLTVIRDGRWERITAAGLEEKPAEWMEVTEESFEEVPF